MIRNLPVRGYAALAVSVLLCAGCGNNDDSHSASSSGPPEVHVHVDHDYESTSAGPHGGELVELGDEQYHAEIIHQCESDGSSRGTNDADQRSERDAGVTVYILDGLARSLVAIDATELAINVRNANQGRQFKLNARPYGTDPQGRSSRFASADQALLQHFHDESTEHTLVVTIDGRQYRGSVAHRHSHVHR